MDAVWGAITQRKEGSSREFAQKNVRKGREVCKCLAFLTLSYLCYDNETASKKSTRNGASMPSTLDILKKRTQIRLRSLIIINQRRGNVKTELNTLQNQIDAYLRQPMRCTRICYRMKRQKR